MLHHDDAQQKNETIDKNDKAVDVNTLQYSKQFLSWPIHNNHGSLCWRMQHTRHALTDRQSHFFRQLQMRTQCVPYFYGSIQRADYIAGDSDIDLSLFAANPEACVSALALWLGIPKTEIHPFVWRVDRGAVVHGYKYAHRDTHDPHAPWSCDICIYSRRDRPILLEEYREKMHLPWWTIGALVLLKLLHYWIGIVGLDTYKWWKKRITSLGCGRWYEDGNFVVKLP